MAVDDLTKPVRFDPAWGIPREAWDAYRTQRSNAKRRGIAWQFTIEAWWAWWNTDARWARRGRHRRGVDELMMARFGDQGPYSPENTYAATPAQNAADVPYKRKVEAAVRGVEQRHAARKTSGDPGPSVAPLSLQGVPPGLMAVAQMVEALRPPLRRYEDELVHEARPAEVAAKAA